jgi:hypothetical protein
MSIQVSRAMATAAAFAVGAICATSVGIATAHPSHPSATAKVKPVMVRRTVHVKAANSLGQYALCPKGDTAVGGGAGWSGGGGPLLLVSESGPVQKSDEFVSTKTGTRPVEWLATLVNNDTVKHVGYVWVECVA